MTKGGFIIPEVAYIDKPINNFPAKLLRDTGWYIVRFGSWIKSLGYYQVEIHPRQALINAMKDIEIERR